MRTDKLSLITVLLVLGLPCMVQAQQASECTTTDAIQFPRTTIIPPNLTQEQAREAVLVALGFKDVNVPWARSVVSGQWFFEYEDDTALYTGFSIRTHYLRAAVFLDYDKVTSIVCDSRNLDQSARRIHRKAPVWKGNLDDNIRIALGQAAEYYRRYDQVDEAGGTAEALDALETLRRAEVLTDEEFKSLRQRVIDND